MSLAFDRHALAAELRFGGCSIEACGPARGPQRNCIAALGPNASVTMRGPAVGRAQNQSRDHDSDGPGFG